MKKPSMNDVEQDLGIVVPSLFFGTLVLVMCWAAGYAAIMSFLAVVILVCIAFIACLVILWGITWVYSFVMMNFFRKNR